jgi:glycosyltransferase involved in cell wall biosynthesis
MRVAVIHNLPPGGAHRRLREQVARLDAEVVEVCPATATPIRGEADVIGLRPRAPSVARPLRVPLRYLDLAALLRAWRAVAARVRALGVDVVYANPCRFLQAPAALLAQLPPSLYFCDEWRRVDYEPGVRATRRRATRPVYAPLHAAERRLDRRAVARAGAIATNSAFSAEQIFAGYGRRAEIVPMGVSSAFAAVEPREPEHVLSVGTLIPSKGHELVLRAAALLPRPRPVVVVAPRDDAEYAARLRAVAGEAGVPLELRIGLSDQELAETYAAAFATVYVAAREPLGLASLEAQAAGSPVVVAAEGGLPETVMPGVTGWAVPREPGAVAARLQELERPGVREAMSAAARRRAATLGWERSARAVQEMLERLCRS